MAGVSNATAKLNILDCDGYGLLNYFEGRCREGKYKDRDCVYVQTKTGEKIVLVSGGGKDGDEKLIRVIHMEWHMSQRQMSAIGNF